MTYGDRTRGEATKADGVYLEVRNQILYGVLEPASRIDYPQLSASLGVSITPLREALRRLEADHLVIRIAHRDVIVAPLTREEATELVQVRRELDLLAARLAAAQMTAAELAAARELVASRDEEQALRYLRDAGVPVAVGGPLTVNRAFHRMVYCGSHNQVLIQYRDAISTRTERYAILARQIYQVAPEAFRRLHQELLTALENRDPAAAAAVMQAHYRELDLDFANVIFGPAAEGLAAVSQCCRAGASPPADRSRLEQQREPGGEVEGDLGPRPAPARTAPPGSGSGARSARRRRPDRVRVQRRVLHSHPPAGDPAGRRGRAEGGRGRAGPD